MSPRTPYAIPGPAGASHPPTPRLTPLSTAPLSTPRRVASPDLSNYTTSSWSTAVASLHCPLVSSVSLLRTRALARNKTLSPSLVVRLDTFHHVGRDVLANLSDPTGSLATSIHASVLETFGPDLRVGAVLVLANIRAITHHSKTSAGFRTDPSSQVHLTLSNAATIARIYDSRVNDAEGDGESRVLPARLEPLVPHRVLDAYAAAARSPKALVRTRKRPVPSPLRQPQFSARQKRPQYQPQPLQRQQHHRQEQHPLRQGPSPSALRTQNPNSNSYHLPPQHQQQHTPHRSLLQPVAPISDDALDELLCDVDIDAMIAARAREQPVQPALPRAAPSAVAALPQAAPSGNVALPHAALRLLAVPVVDKDTAGDEMGDAMDDLLGDFDIDAVVAACGRGMTMPAAKAKVVDSASVADDDDDEKLDLRDEEDDDVDDLLGDIDIDAAIIASGRLPTQVPVSELTRQGGHGENSLSTVVEKMASAAFPQAAAALAHCTERAPLPTCQAPSLPAAGADKISSPSTTGALHIEPEVLIAQSPSSKVRAPPSTPPASSPLDPAQQSPTKQTLQLRLPPPVSPSQSPVIAAEKSGAGKAGSSTPPPGKSSIAPALVLPAIKGNDFMDELDDTDDFADF